MTDLSEGSLEQLMNEIWDKAAVAFTAKHLFVSLRNVKLARRIIGRIGEERYAYLQRRGARPKGCRS